MKFYVNGWKKSEENMLAAVMLQGMKNGEKVGDSLKRAEQETGRSAKSCMNRWYAIRFEYLDETE